MNRACWVQLLILGGIFSCRPAVAENIGPVPIVKITYPGGPILTTFPPTFMEDYLPASGIIGTNISGAGYLSGPTAGNWTVTSIFGLDLNPGGSQLEMTGFDPSQPQIVPTGPETIFGVNSMTYYSNSSYGAVPLSALPGLFPGLDLSVFQGDQTSVVYPFTTVVPLSAVPEPSSVLLAGIGAIALMGYGRHVRKRKRPVG